MASSLLRWAAPALALVAAALTACADPAELVVPPSGVEPLSSVDHLVRASMALRGIRPSVDDLHRVHDDPDALPEIVDAYLQTPEFGRTIRDLHNESLLVRPDFPYFPAGFQAKPPLDGVDLYYLNRSIMDAPLRLIEHVVMNDRPYTEIVTADYTLANEVVAAVWTGLSYDPAGPEWQVTKWADQRGNAGILSDPWLFTRHSSTVSNANRGRANAISKALLCYDFLSRDIVIDSSINLADPNVVQNAVVDNAACASCHQALDPLASFFQGYFPIYVPDQIDYPFDIYYPNLFETYLGVEMRDPSYFGEAGDKLIDLGTMMAADPRFSLCAAKRFYAYFNQVGVDDVPLEEAANLQRTLIDSGMNAKALARAIVLSDDFAASHARSEDGAEAVIGMKKARPQEIATMIEDLTGFRWEVDFSSIGLGRVNLAEDSFLGYQVIAGGIDSVYVTRPSHTDSATTSLYLRAFAAEASAWAVQKDFAQQDHAARKLFGDIEVTDVDESVVRRKIDWLHARIYGELMGPESAEVGETYGLFRAVLDRTGDTRRAWKATLDAMLQDVRVSYY